jgi:hypothetical protein
MPPDRCGRLFFSQNAPELRKLRFDPVFQLRLRSAVLTPSMAPAIARA